MGFKCPLRERRFRFRKEGDVLVTQGSLETVSGGFETWRDLYLTVCASCIANFDNSCRPEVADKGIRIPRENRTLPDSCYY